MLDLANYLGPPIRDVVPVENGANDLIKLGL